VLDGRVRVAGELEEMGANGVDAVVAVHSLVDLVEHGKAGQRSVDHRRGDGAIDGHDGVPCHLFEQLVEAEDLPPVGLGCGRSTGVDGGDRSLQPLLLLRTMLGLEPLGDHLVNDPGLPSGIGVLALLDIPGRWGRVDAFARGEIDLGRRRELQPELGGPHATRHTPALTNKPPDHRI
jgi:hypothetical protein